jgi:hypothetical protein
MINRQSERGCLERYAHRVELFDSFKAQARDSHGVVGLSLDQPLGLQEP